MELFNLRKRINRKTYFAGYAFYGLLVIGFLVVANISGQAQAQSSADINPALLAGELVYLLLAVLWVVCIAKQRANDISGKHSLIYFLLAALLTGLLIGFLNGEDQPNRYGPVPPPGVHFD